MDPDERTTEQRVPAEDGRKKPYERPRILYHDVLEAMAAACTPSPPGKSIAPCSTISS